MYYCYNCGNGSTTSVYTLQILIQDKTASAEKSVTKRIIVDAAASELTTSVKYYIILTVFVAYTYDTSTTR